jgi:hypothetical protein
MFSTTDNKTFFCNEQLRNILVGMKLKRGERIQICKRETRIQGESYPRVEWQVYRVDGEGKVISEPSPVVSHPARAQARPSISPILGKMIVLGPLNSCGPPFEGGEPFADRSHSDPRVGACTVRASAHLALQPQLGYYPSGLLGVVLLLVARREPSAANPQGPMKSGSGSAQGPRFWIFREVT